MEQLVVARRRLQRVLFLLVGLTVPSCLWFAIYAEMGAIVPRWPWLLLLTRAVIPGLPETVVRFTAAYPWVLLVFFVPMWGVRRAMRAVDREQTTWAFRSRWNGQAPGVALWRIAVIARCAFALHALTGVLVAGALVVTTADFVGRPGQRGVGKGEVRAGATQHRPGASRVTIRADSTGNRTGVLVQKDVVYDIIYVDRYKWCDSRICAGPAGFHFTDNVVGLPYFWWAEWRRPRPQGRWFEVVGRIDDRGPVFRILGDCEPRCRHVLRAPRSGELVLLVNDVIYRNNTGTMTLEIRRMGHQG